MALTKSMSFAMATSLLGMLSFILAIVAELKKPPSGTPVLVPMGVNCRFSKDYTVPLGLLSAVAALCCAGVGASALFFPYEGKHIPKSVLFNYTLLHVFFHVAIGVTLSGVAMTLWATATEAMHQINSYHSEPEYACPTAKTGVLGGAAFLNLDASLFWLICLMLAGNARKDYFGDGDDGAGVGSGFEES